MRRTKPARKMNRHNIFACCRYEYPRCLCSLHLFSTVFFFSSHHSIFFLGHPSCRAEKGEEREGSIHIAYMILCRYSYFNATAWALSSIMEHNKTKGFQTSIHATNACIQTHSHIRGQTNSGQTQTHKHKVAFFHVVEKQKREADGEKKKNETHFEVASLVQSVWWSEDCDFPFE